MIKIHKIMTQVAMLFVILAFSAIAVAQTDKPNIIFFFVDDLGYGDIGCFWQDSGSTSSKKFDTPAIDKMASEGVMLTHHYISASVCAPSRASLISGRHQGHCEIRNSQFDKPLPKNHTIGSVLKEAGYYTAWIGKGGLAGSESSVNLSGTGSQNLASNPLKQGFDRFFGYHFHSDGHEHYPQNGTTNKGAYIYDDYQQVTNASLDLYTTDAWTAAAKKVIIDEATDGDSQPFFVYLAYDTPHFKMQRPAVAYPPLSTDGDPTTGGIQWTTATDASGRVRYASTADGTGTIDGYTHTDIPDGWSSSEKQHVGMIRRIDNSIADIIQTLKDLGIDDNTICIFSSDNGPHNEGNNPRTFESFANMEGIKRDMWEAGIRVPTVVRWPGGITGTGDENNIIKNDYPSAIWDWMPTFADLADIPAPAWCDGVSLVPSLTGTGTQRDKGYLYFEFNMGGSTPNWAEFPNHRGDAKGQMQCLRVGDYMGIRTQISTGNENFQIYDVTTDPGQATNLAASMGSLQTKMKALAITSRRPGGGTSRPYDGVNLPSVSGTYYNGVNWAAYSGPFPWVPEFRDMTGGARGTSANFDPATHAPGDNSGILYEGYLHVPTAGSYTFYLTTDDGGHLFIHDAHVIDDDFNHSGSEKSASVNLAAGYHPYRLYYKHAAGSHTLSLKWSGPGISKQTIPQANLYTDEILDPTPVVNAGSSYISWLDYGTLSLAGSVDDNGAGNVTNEDVVWSIEASPAGSAAVLTKTSTDWANPTADFTPDSNTAGDYTIRLTATDASAQSGSDILVVRVADDGCKAAQLDPSWTGFDPYDINENCIVDLSDFTGLAVEWLNNIQLTGYLAY